jgi:hypothetical protein
MVEDSKSTAGKSDEAEPIIQEEMQIDSSTTKKPDADNAEKPAEEGNDLDDLS